MLKNTIGIVHFYYECKESGVCDAILEKLPFELCGCVTTFIGAQEQYAEAALSVTMITSDDVEFSVQVIENASLKTRELLTDEVMRLSKELCAQEKPKIVFPFIPILQHFTADDLVATVNALPDPFALFGTVAFNYEDQDGESKKKDSTHFVMAKKRITADIFAFIAFYGNVKPKFHYTSSFALEDSFVETSEITDSEGPILKTVDGIGAVTYMNKRGIITEGCTVKGSSVWAIPAILTYSNGAKVVRAFLTIGEGTENIYATGSLETGAKITFSLLDGEKTVASAEKLLKELFKAEDKDAIAYSCVARAWSLGTKFSEEAQIFANCASEYKEKNKTPYNYTLSYSGGEICPVLDKDGKLVNTLHNYTLIACTFN
jgi:hypothetical protein